MRQEWKETNGWKSEANTKKGSSIRRSRENTISIREPQRNMRNPRPVYQLTGPKPSKLDPYKHQIDVWLDEAPYRAANLRKVAGVGFPERIYDRQRLCRHKEKGLHKSNDPVWNNAWITGTGRLGIFENYMVVENGKFKSCTASWWSLGIRGYVTSSLLQI